MLGRLLPPQPAMNLDSLSLALSQISYLVDNLTKKNYRASQQEIQHVSNGTGIWHILKNIYVKCFKNVTLCPDNGLMFSLCSLRLLIVTVLRQTDIYYAVSSPMWILVAMVKAVARTFTR